MKKMRIAMMAAALCIGTATVTHAQGQQQGMRRSVAVMAMEGITLTADQQAKVDSITKKYQDQQQKMREEMQAGGDMQAMRAKMGEMRTKQLDELKAVLTTDEQKAAFDKNVEAMKNRMGGGRPPGQI